MRLHSRALLLRHPAFAMSFRQAQLSLLAASELRVAPRSYHVSARRHAAAAISTPMRPLDRFVMKRTGSIGSRVGPAVTTTRFPLSAFDGSSKRATCARIVSGSGMRPGPCPSPTAQCAFIGRQHIVAEFLRRFDVALHLRVRPHAIVHRRHQQNGCGVCEQNCTQQIVSVTANGARNESAVEGAITTTFAARASLI